MRENYARAGERIRKERLKYALTLSDAAKAIGISPSLLSLIENGKITPSLKSLSKICSFFSIHIASLFEENEVDSDVFFFPCEKQIEIATSGDRSLRFLLPKKDFFEPVLVVLYPNSVPQEFTVHKGVEFGYVLEGQIEVQVQGREPILCRTGDSVLYRADLPHKLLNRTDRPARGLWIGFRNMDSIEG